jgi:hypothetical protein
MDLTRESLLRDRIRKLERTLLHYDARLNTRRADHDRQRIVHLELALVDVLNSHATDDASTVLANVGVSAVRAGEILVLLNQKFA